MLPEHQWTPIVATPLNPDVPVQDTSLKSDICDEAEVWRFPIWEPSRFLNQLGVGNSSSRLGSDAGSRSSLLGRFVRWVRGNVFVPDARICWVKPTTKKLLRKLKRNPVDLIVTTGPPHSVHLIGLALKRATGLPWMADFRDPWSTMDYLSDFQLSRRTKKAIQDMERKVVDVADRIVVPSPSALRELGVKDKRQGAVVPNGWDRNDFPPSAQTRAARKTPVLGHFGALYGARNPVNLWAALAQSPWSFRAGGPISESVLQEIEASKVPFTWHGNLPHQEAVKAMLECDALLIVHNDSLSARASVPGKIFECLATGLPLLVIGPNGSDLKDMCNQWGLTFVAHGDGDAKTKLAAWLKNPTAAPAESIRSSFERHSLTTELSELFNTMIS